VRGYAYSQALLAFRLPIHKLCLLSVCLCTSSARYPFAYSQALLAIRLPACHSLCSPSVCSCLFGLSAVIPRALAPHSLSICLRATHARMFAPARFPIAPRHCIRRPCFRSGKAGAGSKTGAQHTAFSQPVGGLQELESGNFEEGIMGEVVFVKFFAPW
jgi:hypothetical protein